MVWLPMTPGNSTDRLSFSRECSPEICITRNTRQPGLAPTPGNGHQDSPSAAGKVGRARTCCRQASCHPCLPTRPYSQPEQIRHRVRHLPGGIGADELVHRLAYSDGCHLLDIIQTAAIGMEESGLTSLIQPSLCGLADGGHDKPRAQSIPSALAPPPRSTFMALLGLEMRFESCHLGSGNNWGTH